jgi:triacylglycerol lipase
MAGPLRHLLAAILISMSTLAKEPETSHVVLVHGFMDTGSVFKPLQRQLESHGHRCVVPNLQPRDARNGIEPLAESLRQEIETQIPHRQSFTLIGFSMGGLVARHYLQQLGGAKRCNRLITISSPHQGTLTAWLHPSKGAQQMRPGSGFLKDLTATESHLGEIPVISYRSPFDLMIFPSRSSKWQRATNLSFTVLLHPMMPGAKSVIADITKRLRED